MSILLVTGTGTDVGKTVTTAAIAACAKGRVAVVKPAQTGVADDGAGDLAEITRLARVTDTYEFARYPDPLSPHHAAMISGRPALDLAGAAQRIDDLDTELDGPDDIVLVEGAGGLLVPFDSDLEWTMIDLAHRLDAPLVVVTAPGLGTLNHTTLTLERIRDESLDVAGVVVGSWPAVPDLAMELNMYDLRRMSPKGILGGVLPAGMAKAAKDARAFRAAARAGLASQFGGTFDWRTFRATLHV